MELLQDSDFGLMILGCSVLLKVVFDFVITLIPTKTDKDHLPVRLAVVENDVSHLSVKIDEIKIMVKSIYEKLN